MLWPTPAATGGHRSPHAERALNDSAARFGPYIVRRHHRDPDRLIVVFASAGSFGLAEPIEEFGKTLSPLGASLCFVIDMSRSWLNHAEAPAMLEHVVGLAADYPHVAAMGESMGGSSAIAFAGLCPRVRRVLAFSPQFSVASPFVPFLPFIKPDTPAEALGFMGTNQRFWTFNPAVRPRETVVLYGDEEFRDLVHAGLYLAYGYDVGFVRGGDHSVASRLKNGPKGNLLPALTTRFADFSAPFSYEAVAEVLSDQISRHVSSEEYGLAAVKDWEIRIGAALNSPQRPPPPPDLHDLALGRITDQSSLSRWSRGKTTAEDSAGALTRKLTGGYAFHTAPEHRPWWSIDFGEQVVVRLLRIFNRLHDIETAARGIEFAIEVSDDGDLWREVYRKEDRSLFGGADGRPFVWEPMGGLSARQLRIRLLGWGALHYDRIEIFG